MRRGTITRGTQAPHPDVRSTPPLEPPYTNRPTSLQSLKPKSKTSHILALPVIDPRWSIISTPLVTEVALYILDCSPTYFETFGRAPSASLSSINYTTQSSNSIQKGLHMNMHSQTIHN